MRFVRSLYNLHGKFETFSYLMSHFYSYVLLLGNTDRQGVCNDFDYQNDVKSLLFYLSTFSKVTY